MQAWYAQTRVVYLFFFKIIGKKESPDSEDQYNSVSSKAIKAIELFGILFINSLKRKTWSCFISYGKLRLFLC